MRPMVDAKLTDTRKRILMLQHAGRNQSEIVEQLLGKSRRPLRRQAGPEAIASIPQELSPETAEALRAMNTARSPLGFALVKVREISIFPMENSWEIPRNPMTT